MVFVTEIQRKYCEHKKHPAARKELGSIPDIAEEPIRTFILILNANFLFLSFCQLIHGSSSV